MHDNAGKKKGCQLVKNGSQSYLLFWQSIAYTKSEIAVACFLIEANAS